MLKDFFDLVRKDPQKYTFADHRAIGSAGHLALELLKRDAGVDTLVIAYKGAAPALDRPDERPDAADRRSDAVLSCRWRKPASIKALGHHQHSSAWRARPRFRPSPSPA